MSIKRVTSALQKLYPLHLAESWDNVGLLVDTPVLTNSSKTKVLLTIDLTKRVVDEAISQKVNLIVAYHPFIFKGIKSITSSNPQHVSLLRLIQAGISVYSPHTAVDSVIGGVNDWIVKGCVEEGNIESSVVISKSKTDDESGVGRVVNLKEGVKLMDVVTSLKKHLGVKDLLVASDSLDKADIKSFAVCAGSGSGVFAELRQDVDLYVTGEMSHHEALMFKEKGKALICANHSNTERGYLSEMKVKLERELSGEDSAEVIISKEDADPFTFV
ncbi:NGG1-interacting factor 3 [Cyberlindnera fabianii]|uniref:NGG1-interacting factor 3 n=1 Tax=Cyberlindnera fabianii TaxID=36022 RepID=A0A1V2LDV2_CYBFA|nr:NGG1-interacting factor 3 [Cyberlindnera fabianii]